MTIAIYFYFLKLWWNLPSSSRQKLLVAELLKKMKIESHWQIYLFRQVLEIFFTFDSSPIFFQTFNHNLGSLFEEKGFNFAFSLSLFLRGFWSRCCWFWLIWSRAFFILSCLLFTFLCSLKSEKMYTLYDRSNQDTGLSWQKGEYV